MINIDSIPKDRDR